LNGVKASPASRAGYHLPRTPRGKARLMLLVSVTVTMALYFLPYGLYLAWPLLLLSTLAHEVGHGLTAVLLGGDFESFRLWSDGSGVATYAAEPSRLMVALVAAGGLIGPAIAAASIFLLARNHKRARGLCFGSAAVLMILLVWVVRNLFGAFFVIMVAAVLVAIGLWASTEMCQLTLVFLAVQLALSVFSRGDYLFTPVAVTAGGAMPSDVAQMADALLLPYWFWGFGCGALSIVALLIGLKAYWR
jgi:hypothetical protein